MNSRMNEDLAWLRVQDMQREAENRRLMAGKASSSRMGAIRRVAARALGWVRSRGAGNAPVARPTVESQHHA